MLTPQEIVDAYYLDVRCKLLEIAAIFDRLDRARLAFPDSAANDDPRLHRCREALALLTTDPEKPDRAEQTALIFSDRE